MRAAGRPRLAKARLAQALIGKSTSRYFALDTIDTYHHSDPMKESIVARGGRSEEGSRSHAIGDTSGTANMMRKEVEENDLNCATITR